MATKAKKPAPTTRVVRNSKKARAQFKAADPKQILGRAMLVNVCVSMWEGRKHDRKVTQEVNEQHNAASDAGRYHKHLFGGKIPELSAIITAAAGIRLAHYTQTLPWSDAGWRLLPTENYMQYTETLRKAIAKYSDAADNFEAAYTKLVRDAKEKLNGMFSAGDYPAANEVRGKYRASLEFSPLPAGGDFRITLPKQELARMAKEVEDRVVRSVGLAMEDAWSRLGDAVVDLREKLDDGKYLRESMIERLRGVAEVLGRLNLTGDTLLEDMRKRVLKDLAVFDAENLRKDEKVRAVAAQRADEILKAMQDVYTPSSDDDEGA